MPDRVHKLSGLVKHPAGSKKLPGVGSSIKLARTTGLLGLNSRLVATVADELAGRLPVAAVREVKSSACVSVFP